MAGYGTDDGFTAWLAANGYTLPDGAPAVAALRQRSSIYIDGTYGPRFSGSPANGAAQEREWPRTGATDRFGNAISGIPNRVVEASYFAAYAEATSPGSLSVTVTPGKQVKRQKVDTIEREFFEGQGDAVSSARPVLTAVEGLLAPLLSPAHSPAILVV
jgi:hypothetical protein